MLNRIIQQFGVLIEPRIENSGRRTATEFIRITK